MQDNVAHVHNIKVANYDDLRLELNTRGRNRLRSEQVLKKTEKYLKRVEARALRSQFKDFLKHQVELYGVGKKRDMLDLSR